MGTRTVATRLARKTANLYKPLPSKAAPSKPISNKERATIDSIFQQRRIPFIGAGIMALCFGVYFSLVFSSFFTNPCPSCGNQLHDPSVDSCPTGRPPALDYAVQDDKIKRQTAEAFDRGLDVPELLMGYGGLREAIAKTAKGRVLEIAVGTGRNLGFYDWTEVVDGLGVDGKDEVTAVKEREKRTKERVRMAVRIRGKKEVEKFDVEKAKLPGQLEGEMLSYTGVDISADMMGVARTRLRDTVPGLKKLMRKIRVEPMPERGAVVDVLNGRVRLCIADAEEPLPPSVPVPGTPADGKYDTIVQSFGLCSVSDPVKLVANMASMVEPGTGRILLLEHGKGWSFINGLLDGYADDHFAKYGCWWNRDIEGIVREAAEKVPGLEVMEVERPLWLQFGTTLMIKLRVNPEAAKKCE
ncbi:hypothetical protein DL546_009218 [Coniochaeta pulveracea]|uniref:Uncharacterized protein n=1 Tax=Coniochaeta pulveracea TaxID=177199 RepID=A0A420YLD7_9PEZI|nr:hypothetical protein DL546_009218 [Coniochaeta pulveracea]